MWHLYNTQWDKNSKTNYDVSIHHIYLLSAKLKVCLLIILILKMYEITVKKSITQKDDFEKYQGNIRKMQIFKLRIMR